MPIRPLDREALREAVRRSTPVPNCRIDGFLEPDFAEAVHDSFPSFDRAMAVGKTHHTVNEFNKVQLTDASAFAPPMRRLNEALAAPEFLRTLSFAFGIPELLADEQLVGGGIHETGPSGRLDVHVDFNLIEDRGLHRRLNLLLFFNKDWKPEWGGEFELWDRDVSVRHHALAPRFNRCVIFETSEISFHGVTAVTCPPGRCRRSFAAYYYTSAAPPGWDGRSHTTIFKARPDERLKGSVLMPLERAQRKAAEALRRARRRLRPR
jgi:hypothetical protein